MSSVRNVHAHQTIKRMCRMDLFAIIIIYLYMYIRAVDNYEENLLMCVCAMTIALKVAKKSVFSRLTRN